MPDFSVLFIKSKGQPITYKENRIVLADKFPVMNGDTLIASIEKTNAEKRQGFFIDITGYCELDGEIIKEKKGVKMLFWEDTMPKQVKLKVFTKQDYVWVENIWERTSQYLAYGIQKESKSTDYGHYGAAMIVEEIDNGRRYRCNDGYPDDDFDDIIFTVQRLKT